MSSDKKEPPRFHIGDWVKFDYGPKKVSAMIADFRKHLTCLIRPHFSVANRRFFSDFTAFEVRDLRAN